ncbi:hypothetical protein AMTR_s00013p00259510 [Amborella trichopoda]|uniref:Enoyl reductase (ER) domain-containing protein n=1 Tax=Amborella trichopoda TaxID=13333 RepID=W1PQU9_AMBTC|nr:hypothetical protein AMTR_s00013p00259510 [Amborella trichopoda]
MDLTGYVSASLSQLFTDVAGEVVEVGSGVQNFKVGDKVVSMLNVINGGGLAEYAVASKTMTVKRPPEVSASEGAALPIAGVTALEALTKAAGGVGHFAVQLAKLGNIHVTATCGARNIELVKSLGADEVIDYKTPKVLVPLLVSPKGENLECMVGLVRDGKIKAVIDSKFPLAEAKEAWAKIMDGHATRKIIVTSE